MGITYGAFSGGFGRAGWAWRYKIPFQLDESGRRVYLIPDLEAAVVKWNAAMRRANTHWPDEDIWP